MVTFTAPSSGASGTFAGGSATASITTGSNGIAVAPAFTANSQAGSYAVSATASGVAGTASFQFDEYHRLGCEHHGIGWEFTERCGKHGVRHSAGGESYRCRREPCQRSVGDVHGAIQRSQRDIRRWIGDSQRHHRNQRGCYGSGIYREQPQRRL